jgi:hypothetical protein
MEAIVKAARSGQWCFGFYGWPSAVGTGRSWLSVLFGTSGEHAIAGFICDLGRFSSLAGRILHVAHEFEAKAKKQSRAGFGGCRVVIDACERRMPSNHSAGAGYNDPQVPAFFATLGWG